MLNCPQLPHGAAVSDDGLEPTAHLPWWPWTIMNDESNFLGLKDTWWHGLGDGPVPS